MVDDECDRMGPGREILDLAARLVTREGLLRLEFQVLLEDSAGIRVGAAELAVELKLALSCAFQGVHDAEGIAREKGREVDQHGTIGPLGLDVMRPDRGGSKGILHRTLLSGVTTFCPKARVLQLSEDTLACTAKRDDLSAGRIGTVQSDGRGAQTATGVNLVDEGAERVIHSRALQRDQDPISAAIQVRRQEAVLALRSLHGLLQRRPGARARDGRLCSSATR